MGPWGIGLGFGASGSSICDYPVEADVRNLVAYDFGAMVGTLGGTTYVGTLVLPVPPTVFHGIGYGADGTEFVGTLTCPGGGGGGTTPPPVVITLLSKDVKVKGKFIPGIANQGISPWSLLGVMQSYLTLISGLDIRRVRVWLSPTRPQLSGADTYIWFRPRNDKPSKSLGPGRWGNRSDLNMEIHIVTRDFSDTSQIDERRSRDFYDLYWKMEQAFQGKNLFNEYTGPLVTGNVWHPPEPTSLAGALTIEPMYMEDLPVPDKTQREEGTLESAFIVVLPVVLALTVP